MMRTRRLLITRTYTVRQGHLAHHILTITYGINRTATAKGRKITPGTSRQRVYHHCLDRQVETSPDGRTRQLGRYLVVDTRHVDILYSVGVLLYARRHTGHSSHRLHRITPRSGLAA